MARIILIRSSNTPVVSLPTLQNWFLANHPLVGCLRLRNVEWLRSYLAVDGQRSICEYEAPYADAVREACREAGSAFEAIWRAEVWQGQDGVSLASCPNPILSEIDYGVAKTIDEWETFKNNAIPYFKAHDIEHLHSLISPDGRRALCTLKASNAEIVQQAHRKAGIPSTHIWRSHLIAP